MTEPLIRLTNLEKFYESRAGRTYVLRQISLDIQEGEFITIMGPSGAGKSTLLHILGMLDGEWGGEYGPYLIDRFTREVESRPPDRPQARIYFVLSTWNPYNTVVMTATIQREPAGD